MPIRIGVVDDDPSVRKGLARLLRSAGFAVSAFDSAEEFLAGADRDAFGCLVLDIHLGGMSGLDLLRRLDRSRQARVVFITAHDEAVTRDALQAAGSPPCLRKPFEADELLAAVNRTLGYEPS